MIVGTINDIEAPDCVKSFVRANPDIEVDQYIERGFNGEVYFGKRTKLNDEVVLKFYIADKGYDSCEEAVILQKIDHDNILKIYDLRFVPPYSALFISPKISGGDLQHQIDNCNLSSKQALEIIEGILLGLTELHSSHSLVHRDLKPGNILLDKENNTPIIADLGSVKKIDQTVGATTTSKATRLYLPPEAIVDEEYYFESDLYQVGVILFQLLGGHFPLETPFDFLTKRERKKIDKLLGSPERNPAFEDMIDTKIVKGRLMDLNTLPAYLNPQIVNLVRKAINPDRTKRFSNPSVFMKVVHGVLRKFPEYQMVNNELIITKGNLTFKIYENTKDNTILEKKKGNGTYRKDNSHDGTFESALDIARNQLG